MRSHNKGFTMIEVIVALAICSGALVMLASVGNESLRRDLRARQAGVLEQACRNKLAECACGAESGREGEFEGLPNWRWKVDAAPVPLGEIRGVERITLNVIATDGSNCERRLSVLRYRAERKP